MGNKGSEGDPSGRAPKRTRTPEWAKDNRRGLLNPMYDKGGPNLHAHDSSRKIQPGELFPFHGPTEPLARVADALRSVRPRDRVRLIPPRPPIVL